MSSEAASRSCGHLLSGYEPRSLDERGQFLSRDVARQVLERCRRRQPEVVFRYEPQGSFRVTRDLLGRLDSSVPSIDDAEEHVLVAERVEPLKGSGVAAPHVDGDRRHGERGQRLEDRVGRKEVRHQSERVGRAGEPAVGLARELDVTR